MLDALSDRKIILGLILLQLAICLPFINSYPICLDEPFSIFWSQQDLNEFMPELVKGNNPPLYFIILHYWMEVFGASPFSTRSLSLLFSILMIPFLYDLTKKITNKHFAIISVLLTLFSSLFHYHSIEARMYSMMVCLTVISFWAMYCLIFEDRKYWWLLGISNGLLLYTHYLGFYIIGIQIFVVLVSIKELSRSRFISLGISLLLTTLLYFPNLMIIQSRLKDFTSHGTWLRAPEWTEIYGNIIRFLNYQLSTAITLSILIIFAVICKKGLLGRLKEVLTNPKMRFVVVVFFGGYFGMYLFSITVQPVFLDRYLLYLLPFLMMMISIYLFQATKGCIRNKKWILLAVAPIAIACYYVPHVNRENDQLANYVKHLNNPRTIITLCPPTFDLNFMYHYDRNSFKDYSKFDEHLERQNIHRIYSFEDINMNIDFNYLIYVDANSNFLYPNNNILKNLDNNLLFLENKKFKGEYIVYYYQKP
ncbi:MAG: glycosyltransferase family 39 protein [Crocinitomicaceae bacterium]